MYTLCQKQRLYNLQRFNVTYKIFTDSETNAKNIAKSISHENTVEIPSQIVPDGFIKDEIVGKIEKIYREKEFFLITISYLNKIVGSEINQLFNVIHGNTSMYQNVRVVEVILNSELEKIFPGPKFGINGIRKLIGHRNSILCPVLKPQGFSSDELATLAYEFIVSGADMIKEDHNLTNQDYSTYRDRIEKITSAVKKANKETGKRAMYFPHISGNFETLLDDVDFAINVGVDGIMLIPSLIGYNFTNYISKNKKYNLPILSHPSFSGGHVLSNTHGIDHGVYYGTMQRILGADMSIFPNTGGRFEFTKDQCNAISKYCKDNDGFGKKIFPAVGGGMSINTAKDMKLMFGKDAVYLLGGGLISHKDNMKNILNDIRKILDS
tara:strand:- start:853 stop:1995 length:1143 start_codon:yes stop_codon:yes gene_type:complete